MRTMLQREGWRVMEAKDGAEGLCALETATPAVVLLDLLMPNMDGFEFSVQLRRRPQWQNIPVIVLTAKDLTAEDVQRLNGHVARVLSKNAFTRDELIQELRRAVEQCRTT